MFFQQPPTPSQIPTPNPTDYGHPQQTKPLSKLPFIFTAIITILFIFLFFTVVLTIIKKVKNQSISNPSPTIPKLINTAVSPTPNPTMRGKIKTVDVRICKEENVYKENFGLGSTSLEITKNTSADCEMELSNEIEGGYTIYLCQIPKFLTSLTLEITNYGTDFASIKKYCQIKKTGNTFLDK